MNHSHGYTSQLSGHARVQHGGQTNAIFLSTPKNIRNVGDDMFDGNQTSFNIIQQHATSSNMVAKRVERVGFNNVG